MALAADAGADVHAAPGNPGMARHAELHGVDPLDGSAVAALAQRIGADLVVVGPEAPLVAGVADAVRDRGIACFGATAAAARLEGSKAFAKEVMAASGVPTARALVCESTAQAAAALDQLGPPYVVKDDRLAAGKGVLVTSNRVEAEAHAARCAPVLIEEYLDGPEVSLFAVSDGVRVLPMLPAQDFKRLADGDHGPNTGGMGAYAPLPWAPADLVDEVVERILQPTVAEMRRRGTPFQGLLYAGLSLTSAGVRVVEFNARFGDPETQALLPLLRTPLAPLLRAAAAEDLPNAEPLRWHQGAAVTIVMATAGYPDSPRAGDPISGLDEAGRLPGTEVIHAGTTTDADGRLVTAGGRVLAVTAVGESVAQARQRAYAGVERIHFAGAQYRRDIAAGQ